jgi:tRNA threonylcarbamoyladenosine biosynthesis protein TsaB
MQNKQIMKQKPLILAIETSGRTGSVAIAVGEEMLSEVVFSEPMKHSAEIFPAIQDLLERFDRRPRQVGHIYVSIGPGSFTGLRIAVTLAKMMHLTNAARIVTVGTLDVIAANATDHIKQKNIEVDRIAAVLDAKRGQFFIAVYKRLPNSIDAGNRQPGIQSRCWEKIFPDSLLTAPQFLEQFSDVNHPTWLLGEGLVYYKDKFKADGIRFLEKQYWNPRASKVHLLGFQKALENKFADALILQPRYLRQPDVKTKS